jgi:hypothetical protein
VSVVSDPDFLIVGAGAAGGPWLREPDFKHDEIWANRRHALINDPLRQPNTPPPDRGRDRHASASSTSSSGAGAA